MKTRTWAFVLLALVTLALALDTTSRADNGFTASATSASGITLGGDVTGPANANSVAKIQGNTVTSGALTEGDALFATSTSNWAQTAFTGDFTCSTSTPGLCTIGNVTSPNSFTTTPSNTVTTTDATVTTVLTFALSASTSYDFVGTIIGQAASTGDLYRADFAFDEQRIASAGPTAVGAAPVALNVRGSTTGLTWPGGTWVVSSNNLLFKVTGASSTTIVWNYQLSASHVP